MYDTDLIDSHAYDAHTIILFVDAGQISRHQPLSHP